MKTMIRLMKMRIPSIQTKRTNRITQAWAIWRREEWKYKICDFKDDDIQPVIAIKVYLWKNI
jgi:hypothetical protein